MLFDARRLWRIKVIQDNLWPVIGANLGFVNVPASGNEPAKADPALARRVANVYRDFLYVFDRNYTVSVARQWQQAQQQDILPGYTVVATWESVRQPSQADAWSISPRGEAGRALVAKMKEEYRGKLGTMRKPQKVSTDTGPSSEPTVCKSTTAQRTRRSTGRVSRHLRTALPSGNCGRRQASDLLSSL